MISSIENDAADMLFEAAQDAFFEEVEAQLAALPKRRRVKRSTATTSDATEHKDPSPGTSVVGPSLVVFQQQLSAEDRQYALDSQTFAEALVRGMPEGSSQEERYKKYNDALYFAGWTTESYTRKTYDSKSLTLTMNEALIQILKTVIGAGASNVLSLVTSGFEMLKGDKDALTIVETGSKNSQVVSFKAVPCIVSPTGGMSMVMGGLDVYSTDYKGNFLFFTFRTQGVHIFQAAGVRNFNKPRFERRRKSIEDTITEYEDKLLKKLIG